MSYHTTVIIEPDQHNLQEHTQAAGQGGLIIMDSWCHDDRQPLEWTTNVMNNLQEEITLKSLWQTTLPQGADRTADHEDSLYEECIQKMTPSCWLGLRNKLRRNPGLILGE